MDGHYLTGGWHLAEAGSPKPMTDVLAVWHTFIDDEQLQICAWLDVHGKWRWGETGEPITGGKITHWMHMPALPFASVGMPMATPQELMEAHPYG